MTRMHPSMQSAFSPISTSTSTISSALASAEHENSASNDAADESSSSSGGQDTRDESRVPPLPASSSESSLSLSISIEAENDKPSSSTPHDARASPDSDPGPDHKDARKAVDSESPVHTAYHPDFMFCGSCTTCSDGPSQAPPPPQLMNMLTKIPTRKKKPKAVMKYFKPGHVNIITNDDELNMTVDMDIDNDNDRDEHINNEDCENGNGNNNGNKNGSENQLNDNDTPIANGMKTAQIYISNLATQSQLNLLESFIQKVRKMEAKTYLSHNNQDPRKSKTVDITYDPIIMSIDDTLQSLNDLGLETTLITQSHKTHTRKNKPCRSALHVEGICCATEVPEVTSILRKLNVEKVSINVTSRMVYVDYFPDDLTASDLANALNQEGFGATVRKDGGKRKKRSVAGEATAETSLFAQNQSKKINKKTATFVESTIVCPSLENEQEVDIIREILEEEHLFPREVRYVSIPNLASRTMKIGHNPKLISAQKLADILMDSGGYANVTVLVDGFLERMVLPEIGDEQNLDYGTSDQHRRCRFLPRGLGVNIVISGIFWAISLVGHFSKTYYYFKYAGLVSVFFGIPSVAMKAFRTLKRKHFDANCMMVTAAFGSICLGEFDEAASVSFLFSISEFLEDQATRKARIALDSIVNMRPDHANLIDPITGDLKIVPVGDLELDDLVCVRTGDQIPSDGVVVEGSSQVDESSLTGESLLIKKKPGDAVSGGTINAGSTRLVVRTTALVEDSAVSRLIRLVEESAANRSPTEQIVDVFAQSYTPVVMFIAVLMCTIPWFFSVEEGKRWTMNGLIIVVIACPCALTISTPVTYAAGLAATAQNGIIVKGGARLEALGNVKTIIFDKTGTLTKGEFSLNDLVTVGTHKTRREVLALLSVMEAPSSHPLAATLVNAAKEEGVSSNDMTVLRHQILKGEGVTALVNGDEVYVGNVKLFERLGFYDHLDSTYKEKAEEWNNEGGTVGFLGVKGIGIVGMFCVADHVRPEAMEVVSTLVNDNYNVMMLTGDGNGAANGVARKVGLPLENIRSQFLPEDKLHFVSSTMGLSKRRGDLFSSKELLLFVGDGVNDAPALAVADVGVAMGAGAALAMEMSDVTLMDSNLSKLLFSIKMGTKVIMTVQENIFFSVFVKLLVIALTFAGKMTLLAAIAADVGVMLLVSLNGMKLLPGGQGSCCGRSRHYTKMQSPPVLDGEIV